MATAGHAADNWERCIYALGEGQLQTPSCSPQHARKHQVSTETAEPRCGRGGNSICGAQPTLRGGHRPSGGHPTAKLPWHFPSWSHNLHRCLQASLWNVLKSFGLTEAENPLQYVLLAWLVLGLFFRENKQTNTNTKCNGGRKRHLEETRRESRSVLPQDMVTTVPGHSMAALFCRSDILRLRK